jgi:hypothetical protein
MAGKKTKSRKQVGTAAKREAGRRRTLQIVFAVFSIVLILTMLLALIVKY